nr:MAG TPA: hypothetical protein [Caudoviricetes sp.]
MGDKHMASVDTIVMGVEPYLIQVVDEASTNLTQYFLQSTLFRPTPLVADGLHYFKAYDPVTGTAVIERVEVFHP